jgi:hypothetical protein
MRHTYLLLLAALALAGCGGATSHRYSPSAEQTILRGCEESLAPKGCRCLLNVMEQHFGENEALLWAEAAGRAGIAAASPPWLREAAEHCAA